MSDTLVRNKEPAVAKVSMVKKIAIGLWLAFSSAFYGASQAEDEWTTDDTYRESVFSGLMFLDWKQTRYIASHPDRYYETNVVLGNRPSAGEVNRYFVVTAVGHAAISYLLPRNWREAWQYVWIGIEAGTVSHNYSMGIGFSL